MTVLQVIEGRERDLGGFVVRRVLPYATLWPTLYVLRPVDVTIQAPTGATLMLLGGARFPTPRLLIWNFVASSHDGIENAKERWRRQEFPTVPNEMEFIPLPS